MDIDLSGKHAVVCGSTQGIGKASAIELASLGASVTLLARDEQKLLGVLAELPVGRGQQHGFLKADFSNVDEVKRVITKYVSSNTVHVLVNNTGGPPGGLAIDARQEEFVKAFAAHLLCNQALVQAVVPSMKKEKYGRIINIISTSVKIPLKGLGVSNTIRGAVASWAKTLSVELAPFGITVNNVLPGATMTGRLEALVQSKAEKSKRSFEEVMNEMVAEIPAGRIGEAREVAAAVAFLATQAAAYINGINIPVDGGRTGSL
ncbi:MAG TPA: SDR family oxidoreductase [Cyclobacteriaceae bacterium]|nr:SDR family oxidoreductase [Cyclobacteriaceae bacterium]HRJ81290.1 SDR family oxidoreductase [Cyclobacteriaceae bacterium]